MPVSTKLVALTGYLWQDVCSNQWTYGVAAAATHLRPLRNLEGLLCVQRLAPSGPHLQRLDLLQLLPQVPHLGKA